MLCFRFRNDNDLLCNLPIQCEPLLINGDEGGAGFAIVVHVKDLSDNDPHSDQPVTMMALVGQCHNRPPSARRHLLERTILPLLSEGIVVMTESIHSFRVTGPHNENIPGNDRS